MPRTRTHCRRTMRETREGPGGERREGPVRSLRSVHTQSACGVRCVVRGAWCVVRGVCACACACGSGLVLTMVWPVDCGLWTVVCGLWSNSDAVLRRCCTLLLAAHGDLYSALAQHTHLVAPSFYLPLPKEGSRACALGEGGARHWTAPLPLTVCHPAFCRPSCLPFSLLLFLNI